MDTDTQPFTPQESPKKDAPKNPPLWKQLMGAVAGMSLALTLYYGYKSAAPVVTAYLVPPGGVTRSMVQGEVAASDKTLTEEQGALKRISNRTREFAQRMLQNRPESEPVTEPQLTEPAMEAPAELQAVAPQHHVAALTDTTPSEAPSLPQLRALIQQNDPLRSGAPAWETDKGMMEKGPIDKGPVPVPPEIPQSGPALWVAGIGALFGAYGMRKKAASV
jgi:hypothetical protein